MSDATTTRSKTAKAPQQAKTWPTVRGRWLTGCMFEVQHNPLAFYTRSSEQHGDYVRLRAIPGYYFYLIGHPSAIEHVLSSNHKNYRKPDMFNNAMHPMVGNGILTSEGDFWRKQRRLMQPAFLKHQVAALGAHMMSSTAQFIGEWEQGEDGRTFDIVPEMMRLALRIASTTLFSTDISSDADSIGHAYRVAFEYSSARLNGKFDWPAWVPTAAHREFRRSKELLDRIVLEVIAGRRHAPPMGDVLDRLLAAQDEESGSGMSDDQLKDEALTLLTAGHETTGAALSWCWYLLATNPQWQAALRDEVQGHLQGRLPTVEDLASLPLATAVFEESMRIYPPAWGVPRETIAPDEINGYPLPAKATLVVSQYLAHRHPDFWPEPERFNPERFLPANSAGRAKFAYFPFGGGPRICIGNHFAMVEGPLILAALAGRFQMTLVPGQQIVPDPTFTLRPKHGVQMTVRKVH